MEKGYMISDASKLVEVENHVLRYWEEDLELPIPRNEMGHRFYRESDIRMLRSIKDLKEQGFQLRAIKKLLPDLERVKHMDSQSVYKLREELNRQVLQETMEKAMESKGSVTSLNQARFEKRQKTWQEKSYELEQTKTKTASVVSESQQRAASVERLRQFEEMMRQMIRGTMEEMSRESEQRICEEVTIRMQKEMNYLLMQKEELQEKQIVLLQEILEQVRREEGKEESGAPAGLNAVEAQEEAAAAQEETSSAGRKKGMRKRKEKQKRKKLFAKSL